jgi:hypothetical protein
MAGIGRDGLIVALGAGLLTPCGSAREGAGGVVELRLEACGFESLTRMRWMLTGPGGALVADHEVRLDGGCRRFDASTDPLRYLRWHAAPYRHIEDEARIVAEVGERIGEQVFGPVAAVLAKARP